MSITPHKGAASKVVTGGQAVEALYGPLTYGGFIYNPRTAREQGVHSLVAEGTYLKVGYIGAFNTFPPSTLNLLINGVKPVSREATIYGYGPPELLYVDLTGPAAMQPTATTAAIYPGETFFVPPGGGPVWVNAALSGHRFTAIALQPATQFPPTPYNGSFPPNGPSTLLTTLPSYLYKQYEDDDDLQAFVMAYNSMTQAFVDWFNNANLPNYPELSGSLLDWVGAGLYGYPRPTLFSGHSRNIGPLNTQPFNSKPSINGFKIVANYTDVAATSDDVYKRLLTWMFFKGDGKCVSIPWLRRRVARFLWGENGKDYAGVPSQISISVTDDKELTITIVSGVRRLTGGALYNMALLNRGSALFNTITTDLTRYDIPALAPIFKQAVDDGVIDVPTQHSNSVRIGIIGAAFR
jgi:hypothetical protein